MKKRMQTGIAAGIVLCLLPGTVCSEALAEESRITKIALEITTDFAPGESIEDGDIQIYADSSEYKVDEWKILNEETAWEGAVVPAVEIVLSQTADPKFSYIGADNLTVRGTEYTFVSSKRSEKDTILNIIIKLPPVAGDMDVPGAIRLDSNGTVSWTPDEHTSYYRVKVYRGSHKVKEVSTYGTLVSLQDVITQPGSYHVKISGVSKYDEKDKADWEISDDLYFTEGMISAFVQPAERLEGMWKRSGEDWFYVNPGDHPASAQWQLIDGKWYFFDAQGIMQRGWVAWNEQWYYCAEDGSMLADGVTPDGYAVGTDGAVTGKEN